MKKILALFQHFIFPQSCPVCGRLGASYCNECLQSVTEKFPPFCSSCGGWWSESQCVGAFPCYAAALYENNAKEFLLNLKYKNCRTLARPMGRLMGNLFENCGADALLPIPLHTKSSRAFNQSFLIAQGVSEIQNIPVEDALFWTKDFGRQVEKRAQERESLPISAINCHPLHGKKIVLVDDVYTTGSTVKSASEAVKRAGGEVCGAYFWCRTARHENSKEFADIKDVLALEID